MSRVFVFDIDGTLANIDHRLQYVRSKPRNYNAFRLGIPNDKVVEQVAALADELLAGGNEIILVSGREDGEGRKLTEKWLVDNGIIYNDLLMRPEKDYRPDDIIKKEILDKLTAMGKRPFAVFEDRKRVKKMWVENGIFVFDVNQTDVEF